MGGGLTVRGETVAGRCSATEVGAARAGSGSGRGGPGGLGGGEVEGRGGEVEGDDGRWAGLARLGLGPLGRGFFYFYFF